MAKFADTFLAEVSDYAFSSAAHRYIHGELSEPYFQKRLHQLKQNVHESSELTAIFFECGYGRFPQKETKPALEQDRLRQMKQALIQIAGVPSGRELLSHMPLDVYMYAMTQEDRGFFSASEKMLSISSRHPTLWVKNQDYLKTFVHEMAHARHGAVCQNNRYGFSPKAFFLESTFDELGARLAAENIYGELQEANIVKHKTPKLSAIRIIDKMEENGYFHEFTQSIFDYLGRQTSVILDEDNTLDRPLKRLFSYYMTLYPQIKQKNVLNKIDAVYRKLVLYPAGRCVGLNRYDVNRRFKDLGYGK